MSQATPEHVPAGDESTHMDQVDRADWGPTEPDERAVLDKLYGYDVHSGTYRYQVGDADMGNSDA